MALEITVEKAGSFDIDKVAAGLAGRCLRQGAEGYVRIHENHHLWSKTRVGKARVDGQYDVVYETSELVEPDPFPKAISERLNRASGWDAPSPLEGEGWGGGNALSPERAQPRAGARQT